VSGAKTRFDLLRHGQTDRSGFFGSSDVLLTLVGWEQMRRTTADRQGWQAVVSSPRSRCLNFAAELCRQRGLPLIVEHRLAEIHFGAWEGFDAQTLMQTDPAELKRFWDDPWSFTPAGAESMTAFESRVRAAWIELSSRLVGQHVLVVTHGGVIRLLRTLAERRPRDQLLTLDVPYASMHPIEAFDGETR